VYRAGLDGNINGKCEFFLHQISLYMKAGEILSFPQTLIQSSHKYDGNLCCLSGLRRPCLAMTKWFNIYRVWEWVLVYLHFAFVPACMLRLDWNCYMQIQYLIFIWRTQFGVKPKCIAMLSITNSSLLRMLEWVLCDWKQCCSQYLISESTFREWAWVLTDLRSW